MKSILSLLFLLSLTVLLSACATNTWNNSNKITLGMTKAELITAIGPPEVSMSPAQTWKSCATNFSSRAWCAFRRPCR